MSAKEKQEVMTKYHQEKDFETGLKAIIKEKASEVLNKIKEDFQEITVFLEKIKGDEKVLKKYIPSEFQEQIRKLTDKKKKEVEVKKIVKLKCFDADGVKRIKDIFENNEEKIKVTYISAGNYLVSIKSEDYKKANQKMQELVETIEKRSKKGSCEMSVEEEKLK